MFEICVFGAGSWGTAMANLIAKKNLPVFLASRDEDLVTQLNKERINQKYLPDIHLSENITFSLPPSKCQLGIFAIPAKFLRSFLLKFNIKVDFALSLIKGMEDETFLVPSGIINQVINVDLENFAVLSGPNFAKEVALELPTATVIASKNAKLATKLQQLFNTRNFRVYTSSDYIGVEYLGALKNVLALACGISDGLKLGNNARASLITRGIAEITRIYKVFGGKSKTITSLAGIGDIVLTTTGNLSRNRQVGLSLSQGKDIDTILKEHHSVPEGVNTVNAVYKLCKKFSIDAPIVSEVYKIIYERKDPFESIYTLMNRPLKAE